VDETWLGIGQLARASGLTVSALRFYDAAGVLPPAQVDASSGYRWYRREQLRQARVIARLRRVGMPLKDVKRILDAGDDAGVVAAVVAAHLRRLEDGLTEAKRVLSTVQAALDGKEESMGTTITMAASRLAAAAAAVRHAVGTDPELPMLRGVLVEADPSQATLRLVTTDRYRLALASVTDCDIAGPAVSVLAPPELLDVVASTGSAAEDQRLSLELASDGVRVGGERRRYPALDFDFPDYRRVLRPGGAQQATVGVDAFRSAVADAASRVVEGVEVVSVAVTPSGEVSLSDDGDGLPRIVVNREFLLQAADALDTAHDLVLELDGPLAPLAMRDERSGMLTMIMPVRADG
jgi:DNA-binding transcriptional MerR regulator